MKKRNFIYFILDCIAIVFLVLFDYFTKQAAVSGLKNRPPVVLIPNVLQLQYLENRGAAFGMLQNKKILFVLSACFMLAIIIYVLVRLPMQKKFIIWHLFLCFIAAGGIGNLIDRVINEYVVDFIYFVLIDFPVFNVADILVSVGCFLFFVDILFFIKDEDLSFLKWEKKKNA